MAEPVKLAPPWIAWPELKHVFAALGAPALDVRCVGGCVRDAAMGIERQHPEIDIGTPDPPERVIVRLNDAGIKWVPTGLDHGTVTAVIGAHTFEITSLRRDTACDGRHAAVEFTTDWREDVRRRDFTFNAMSMALDGVVHDDHGGLEDARAKRVRFVGDPDDRIQEDYLRILRLFRFAALYGREPIAPAVLEACRRHKDGLARLSAERVHDEMAKLLGAADPVPAATQMEGCGVLAEVIPECKSVDGLARMLAVERNVPDECQVEISKFAWVRRLAALIPRYEKESVAKRLKLSNDERKRLAMATEGSPVTPAESKRDRRWMLFHFDTEAVMNNLLTTWATGLSDRNHSETSWQELIAEVCAWEKHPLPITGQDIIVHGVPRGPEFGRLISAMTEWWIDEAFQPSREDALKHLESLIHKR
jgi:poly(A) polymerase